MFGVSLHDGGVIRDGGYVLELLLKCCVQSVCIESVFHCEHYIGVIVNRVSALAYRSSSDPGAAIKLIQ